MTSPPLSSTPMPRHVSVSAPKFVGLAYRTHSWRCPRPSHFSIVVMYARDNIHLQLTGELDGEGSDALTDCIEAALMKQPRQLVLDLSALGSIDALGLRCLRDALQWTDAAGVCLVLDSPQPAVLEVIVAVGGREEFTIR